MSFPNPSADQKSADVQKATASEAKPVEANVTNDAPKQEERRYTVAEMERIVKDRLTREQKKFAKEKETWQSGQSEAAEQSSETPSASKQVNPIEAELKTKLNEERARSRTMADKLAKLRDASIVSVVERELVAQGCVDPELVLNDLRARKLVSADDEGNLVVETEIGSLQDLVTDYLTKKPHLKRADSLGGVGSKGPQLSLPMGSEKDQLVAAIESSRVRKPLFGK